MIKITGSINIGFNSKQDFEFEVLTEDWESMSQEKRNAMAREKAFECVDWSYEVESAGEKIEVSKKEWTEDAINLLGTMSDAKLSVILGYCSHTILRKRQKLGIKSHQNKRTWTNTELNIIRKNKAKDAAKILRCSVSTIEKQKEKHKLSSAKNFKISWSEESLKLVGSMHDLDLAKKLGICRASVYKKRVQLKREKYTPE
ncbi:MAG: hypothetical protein HRT88_09695 [Lentisphaeraceae bacterium]|nr:hypothetical protein [Lentisphaeraceae bacterium]